MAEENVLHAVGDVETVQSTNIDELKRIAMSHPLKRARLCLHQSRADLMQEMIIVAHQSTYMRPHRHPATKSESYHIIQGELEVRIFRPEGALDRVICLANKSGSTFMYRVTNGWWHQPVPLTEWVAYHETYTGPFDKATDVEYADWAPAE